MFLLDLVYVLTSTLYYSILRLLYEADETDVDLIIELHHYAIPACLYFAIALTALIFLSFILIQFDILRVVDTRLTPNALQD